MSGTEMDMVGNVLPQIFNEGATEDKGEMARLVSTLFLSLCWYMTKFFIPTIVFVGNLLCLYHKIW